MRENGLTIAFVSDLSLVILKMKKIINKYENGYIVNINYNNLYLYPYKSISPEVSGSISDTGSLILIIAL